MKLLAALDSFAFSKIFSLAQDTAWGGLMICFLIACCEPVAFAEGAPSTFGEIKINGAEKKGTYGESVKTTAEFFEAFGVLQSTLANGGKNGTVASIGNDSLFYLTGLYLYCIQKSGICRLIPDALYEVELVRGFLHSAESCNSMAKFWEFWREQGMEERSKYVVPMASIKLLSDYNEQERPRFLKCNTSVKTELGDISGNFFSKRYALDARRSSLGKTIAQVIRQLEDKNINVFLVTGAMGGESTKKPSK